MASASSFQVSLTIRSSASAITQNQRLFVGFGCGYLRKPALALPQYHSPSFRSRPVLACARRRNKTNSPVPDAKKKKQSSRRDDPEVDDLDDDAFEALFQQLAEDLKNDDLSSVDDDEEEIRDEELAKLERELEEAVGNGDLMGLLNSALNDASEEVKEYVEEEDEDEDEDEDEELAKLEHELEEAVGNGDLMGLLNSVLNDASEEVKEYVEEEDEDEDEDEEVDDDEEEEEGEELDDDEEEEEELEPEQVELKRWQLRRLAYALKNGRRKTSIKSLAADICVDRAVVLKLLRDPPPNLLMLSATLPDEPEARIFEPEVSSLETISSLSEADETKLEAKEEVSIHSKQRSWSAKKRIKKVHVQTLETVYRRTKRPTNTMVGSIIHVTNLPRKIVLKWFEDKRAADGVVSDRRKSYQRSASETVFT